MCVSSKECCDNLVCSTTTKTCDCPADYQWSNDFSVCYKCPDGWSFYNDNCYFLNFDNPPPTWNDAHASCENMNGQLITFDSNILNDQIIDFLGYFGFFFSVFYVIIFVKKK